MKCWIMLNKKCGILSPDVQETILEQRKFLRYLKFQVGKVAGSKITEGEINSNSDVRIIRDGAIILQEKFQQFSEKKPSKTS